MRAFRIITFASVFAFLWLTSTGCAGPAARRPAATQPAAGALAPAQIVILGTLHERQRTNVKYSASVLHDIIVELKPVAILVELPPAIGGKPTVEDGRIAGWCASANESMAANRAAKSLRVQIIPFDRNRRNEIYQETRYFERQKKASSQFLAWLKTRAEKAPDCQEVLTWKELYRSLRQAESELMEHAGPEAINSVPHDAIKRSIHCVDRLWPKMLAAAGQEELAGEFAFFAEEWQERNEIMAQNIAKAAARCPGGRIVVVTGGDHRYILRDLLAKERGIELKEYYELAPDGSAPKAR